LPQIRSAQLRSNSPFASDALVTPSRKQLICGTASGEFDIVIPQSILSERLPIRVAGADSEFPGA
jgi:hypothetical protein